MALTKCDECGKVSTETSKCPHCGTPKSQADSLAKKLMRNPPIFWGLLIVLGGALMAWLSNDGSTPRIFIYGTIGSVLLVALILFLRFVDSHAERDNTDEERD